MGQIYLNGQPVDELPPEALKIMSERLSAVVSRYFTAHPDEYVKFLEGREKRRKAQDAANPSVASRQLPLHKGALN